MAQLVFRVPPIVERNKPKFGPLGYLVYKGYFWLLSVQGQCEVIWYVYNFQQDYVVMSVTYIAT